MPLAGTRASSRKFRALREGIDGSHGAELTRKPRGWKRPARFCCRRPRQLAVRGPRLHRGRSLSERTLGTRTAKTGHPKKPARPPGNAVARRPFVRERRRVPRILRGRAQERSSARGPEEFVGGRAIGGVGSGLRDPFTAGDIFLRGLQKEPVGGAFVFHRVSFRLDPNQAAPGDGLMSSKHLTLPRLVDRACRLVPFPPYIPSCQPASFGMPASCAPSPGALS